MSEGVRMKVVCCKYENLTDVCGLLCSCRICFLFKKTALVTLMILLHAIVCQM